MFPFPLQFSIVCVSTFILSIFTNIGVRHNLYQIIGSKIRHWTITVSPYEIKVVSLMVVAAIQFSAPAQVA